VAASCVTGIAPLLLGLAGPGLAVLPFVLLWKALIALALVRERDA
jgi:hypothetical protein